VKKLGKKNCNSIKFKATSLTALLVSVFLLSALAGVQFVGKVSAEGYTETTGTLDGADFALRIPDPWNGMLVIICRGYSSTPVNPVMWLSFATMLNQGFAIAASNYGAVGSCVSKGVDSTYNLTRYIIDNYNVTGKVFLYGLSMGGAIALLLGEKYPDVYSGVLDLFGPKDYKEHYAHKDRWANLSDVELTAELTVLGAGIPPYMFSSLESFQDSLATGNIDIELETGGTPATHPTAYENISPAYHANIMIPVITVHGTSDAMVLFNQSIIYQAAVANAGCLNLYRLYNVTGGEHMHPSVMSEVSARFDELVAWSDALTEGPYDWPMFGHDLQRSRYSASPAPNTNQTLWKTTLDGMVGSSPAIVDGKVYLGSFGGNVYCLDAATGAEIWNYTTGDQVYSSPAVVDGKVYVSSLDRNVYCLDALSGAKIWNYTTGDQTPSSPAVVDGKVYVGSYDGNVYCLDAETGTKIWNYTVGDSTDSDPAVADGRVYLGSDDYNVYCLDATTGTKIWNYTTGNIVWSSPAVVDGKVYVGSEDNNLYCLDALTGALIWNYPTGGKVNTCPAVADGKVYLGSDDYNVYCLDATTGTKIWNYTTGGIVFSSPAVADGKVYVGSYDRKVYCLDATNGAFIWSYATGFNVFSSPAIANGVVYIGSTAAVQGVYAFSPWVPIPEGLTFTVMAFLSSISLLVGSQYLRKRSKKREK